jgi:hypothetical protein
VLQPVSGDALPGPEMPSAQSVTVKARPGGHFPSWWGPVLENGSVARGSEQGASKDRAFLVGRLTAHLRDLVVPLAVVAACVLVVVLAGRLWLSYGKTMSFWWHGVRTIRGGKAMVIWKDRNSFEACTAQQEMLPPAERGWSLLCESGVRAEVPAGTRVRQLDNPHCLLWCGGKIQVLEGPREAVTGWVTNPTISSPVRDFFTARR